MKTTDSNSIMSDLLTEKELATINHILTEQMGIGPEQLAPEAVLDADLGADSLTKVEIIMAIEEEFGVTIPDELSERVQTVEDVYEALVRVMGRTA